MKISAPHLRVEWFGTLGSRRENGHNTCMQDSNTEEKEEAVRELLGHKHVFVIGLFPSQGKGGRGGGGSTFSYGLHRYVQPRKVCFEPFKSELPILVSKRIWFLQCGEFSIVYIHFTGRSYCFN